MAATILLIDDEAEIVLDVNFSAFSNDNYKIITHSIPEIPSPEILRTVDIIILDYDFGQPKTGIDFLRELRKNKAYLNIPIIFLSKADDFPKDERDFARKSNVVDFISKSCDSHALQIKVDSAIKAGKTLKKRVDKSMFAELKQVLNTWKLIVFDIIPAHHRRLLFLSVFLMLIAGFLTNLPAVVLGYLVDYLLNNSSARFGDVSRFIIIIIVTILARECIIVLRKYLTENTCTQLAKQQKVDLIAHILRVDLRRLQGMMAGALQGRISRSLEGLNRLLKLSFLDFFPVLFTALTALLLAFMKCWYMALVMLLVIPVGFLIILLQVTSQKGIRIGLLRANEDIDGKTVELLTSLESVRASNTQDKEISKVEGHAEVIRSKEITHHIWMAFFDSLKAINEGFFYIIVIILSLYLAFKGFISKGDILTYSVLYISVLTPLRQMHRILDEAYESFLRVQDLMQLRSIPQDPSFATIMRRGKRIISTAGAPAFQIQGLSFSFGERDSLESDNVLNNVSCTINRGEQIGIAGPSGCGKSTFVKLLLRLLHYEEGEIFLNGILLREFYRDQIASLCGYVQQRPLIVSGTILENITYGYRSDFRFEEIMDAAKKAMIHDEIINDLGGYYGIVREGGRNLSGGQMQRIAISRLFLYKPEIIILDEATAALDNINERYVHENLELAMKGNTVIMIAHRLSTLRTCDKIFAFNEGKITEQGTYEELLKKQGLFYELHRMSQITRS